MSAILRTDFMTMEWHLNQVPAFAAEEIDRLHGHLLCSARNYRAEQAWRHASAWVARRAGVPVAILLFRIDGHTLTLLNEFVRLEADLIRQFADAAFQEFPQIHLICLRRIEAPVLQAEARAGPGAGAESASSRYPHQRLSRTEDIVVALPPTVEEYEARLGKNMRRNLRRYSRQLETDFPGYEYALYLQKDIRAEHIREIIALNHARMAGKHIQSRIDEEETRWVIQLAQECGIMGVATIDGRVCGGAIGFRIGDAYFMHIIAHDPAYNEYSLGILCYYTTICAGIQRGGKRFHLLPGRYEYKYRLLGENRDIVQLDLYRNRWQMLRHGQRVLSSTVEARMYAARTWLLDAERRANPWSRRASVLLRWLRQLKRGQVRTRAHNQAG